MTDAPEALKPERPGEIYIMWGDQDNPATVCLNADGYGLTKYIRADLVTRAVPPIEGLEADLELIYFWLPDEDAPEARKALERIRAYAAAPQNKPNGEALADLHIVGNRAIEVSRNDLEHAEMKARVNSIRDFLSAPTSKAGSVSVEYTPGNWYHCETIDQMEAFYKSRLPAIREAARECGYAIGLHGSMRRDLDLIAMPWVDEPKSRFELAKAVQLAACGFTSKHYDWALKPHGRLAAAFPICWCEWHDMTSAGHIDLSVAQR